jgi:hypothetical protein
MLRAPSLQTFPVYAATLVHQGRAHAGGSNVQSENDSADSLSAPRSAFGATALPVENPANSEAGANRALGSRKRRRDFEAINRDIQSWVKARPGAALGTAVVLGFILGRLFSRP